MEDNKGSIIVALANNHCRGAESKESARPGSRLGLSNVNCDERGVVLPVHRGGLREEVTTAGKPG